MDPVQNQSNLPVSAPPVEDHAAPPPPPVDSAPTPPLSTPPPPPPAGVPAKPKVTWGKGALVGSILMVTLLVAGLAVGSFLNSRKEPTRIDTEAAGSSPTITGTGCSGDVNGINCNAPAGGSVYRFVCAGNSTSCGNGVGALESQSGPSSSLSSSGVACDKTVQLDTFTAPSCQDQAGVWSCGNTTGFAIWYSGPCGGTNPTNTPPPTSGGNLVGASCSQGISGSGLANNVTQVHLYFDSGPEDYTSTGGDGHAAVKEVSVSGGSFNYSLLDTNNLLIAKEVGGNVNLGDGQSHRVRAFAINGSSNPELTGSNLQFTLQGRILGRIWATDQTLDADPNKQLTKCENCSYSPSLPVCNNAITLNKSINIDGGNIQTVNQCNAGGPNYDVDLTMGTHSLVLSSGTNEAVGWTCSSDNGVGCPAASGTGYTVTTSAATCAPLHIHFYVAGVPTPTATPPDLTPTPTIPFNPVMQCEQVSVTQIMRGGTAIENPTLAKVQKGDQVTFRGSASAVDMTVSHIRFTIVKGGVSSTVDVPAVLQSGQYVATTVVNIDAAVTYGVTAAPLSE